MNVILILFFIITIPIPLQGQSTSWWKNTVVYQIYPRSFCDSNADGIGDIQGIISKLDYLEELGVETIWISPFFQSPQQDFGYDISDYYKIDSIYGDSNLVQQLIAEVHLRGMYIVFDLVMNHTSVEHHWFKESSKDTSNSKADWYVWKTGKKNGKRPPNNWKSTIGGSGWHYHPKRKQWYFSSFLPWQPDLNYHNPATKSAMLDVARYWLAKGVDGFRLDIFNVLYEDQAFKNNPFSWRALPSTENPDGFQQKMKYTVNHPLTYVFAKELRSVLDSFRGNERFTVGEVFGDHEATKKYLGDKANGLNLVFQFDMLAFKFNAKFFANKIKTYEEHYPAPYMPTLVFGNHDRKRSISRIKNNSAKAKLIAFFQLTARGTPFIYQGEEIGMTQAKIPTKKAKDPLALKYKWIPQFLVNMSAESLNRDECRTPMQWDSSANGGFCPKYIQPWLPVNDNYNSINIEQSKTDSTSLWSIYKKLLQLRREHQVLQEGSISLISTKKKHKILAYKRIFQGKELNIIINFSKQPITLNFDAKNSSILNSLHEQNNFSNGNLRIQGYSAILFENE